ncbi:hypothetical protein MYCTH_2296430 [Thermothelomyces thermophilus ATCC 42464]|uniref:Uncharacterized protein n=1 Tax=Thermothelomyces thermophilus (strain ATCC 42464 / BCRC 31852 / DSM 1799) TaxID=573729 RepID=G2Q1I3_THET4|nr:uncharacterized protein MYCTH_2296430 [Thermothelomyces thermophilus ATCC 42464]AEO54173.1 hypothetical protein MYCTH_2296430 [Thermothelomyces thermophilus ATCC 42464]
MPPPVAASADRGDARRLRKPSTLYKLVMTPVLFVSFLLSLALVDLRYSSLRALYHADSGDQPPGRRRLPGWLHRIIYRYRPYRYAVAVDGDGRPVGTTTTPRSPGSPEGGATPSRTAREAEDYYHSKQRELIKMEAEEAFEIRGVVVLVLGFVGLAVLWAAWKVVSWGVGAVYRSMTS